MRAEVKSPFQDRETGKVYMAGDSYEGGEERVAELAAGGFVIAPKRKPPVRKAPKEQ